RIQVLIVELRHRLAADGVAAGLGEDLDSSEAWTIVLRRERVRIDAHLANRRLRRKRPTKKAVDVNLSATGPWRGTGQRLELLRQFLRVVRQGGQLPPAQHDGASVRRGIGVDAGSLVVHVHNL